MLASSNIRFLFNIGCVQSSLAVFGKVAHNRRWNNLGRIEDL
jgi:hypothetical protein